MNLPEVIHRTQPGSPIRLGTGSRESAGGGLFQSSGSRHHLQVIAGSRFGHGKTPRHNGDTKEELTPLELHGSAGAGSPKGKRGSLQRSSLRLAGPRPLEDKRAWPALGPQPDQGEEGSAGICSVSNIRSWTGGEDHEAIFSLCSLALSVFCVWPRPISAASRLSGIDGIGPGPS